MSDSEDDEDEAAADEGRYDAPLLPPLLILAVVGLLAVRLRHGRAGLAQRARL